ncbi:hypothetical protein [Streptomyces sp. NPDC048242]|uniref:hypothetical protein n=1 Tax=Streptomyces sp. NPDC048242 TaxID=3155026 RepID=UPI00343B5850
MSKFQLVMRGADGQIVPVGADNPLPMTVVGGSPATTAAGAGMAAGPAVADLPSGATNAQIRASFNELLASLREAGFIEDEPDTEPNDGS